jgi:hypothetical protein
MGSMLDGLSTAKANSWNLQRTYNWEFILPDISGGIGSAISPYIQEVKFGDYNFDDVMSIRHGAYQSHAAGFLSIGDLSITIYCPTDLTVISYFQQWKDLIVDSKGIYGYKAEYAKTGYLTLMDRKYEKTQTFKFINMFPKTFPAYQLNYAEEGMVKFTINFCIDRVEKQQ